MVPRYILIQNAMMVKVSAFTQSVSILVLLFPYVFFPGGFLNSKNVLRKFIGKTN